MFSQCDIEVTPLETVPHFSLPNAPLFRKLRPTRTTVPDTLPSRNNNLTSLIYLTVWTSTRSHVFPAPVIEEHNVSFDDGIPSTASVRGRLKFDPLDKTVALSSDKFSTYGGPIEQDDLECRCIA